MSHYYRASAYRASRRQEASWRRNQNTTKFTPAMQLGPISHTVLVALMVAVLGLIYLTQVTKTSSYSYDINERQERLSALKVEKEDLENENARLQALGNIANSDVAQAMTEPESVDFAN